MMLGRQTTVPSSSNDFEKGSCVGLTAVGWSKGGGVPPLSTRTSWGPEWKGKMYSFCDDTQPIEKQNYVAPLEKRGDDRSRQGIAAHRSESELEAAWKKKHKRNGEAEVNRA